MQLALALDPVRPVTSRGYRSWMEQVAIAWWNTTCCCGASWSGGAVFCRCGLHPDGNCGSRGICYGDCGLAARWDDKADAYV